MEALNYNSCYKSKNQQRVVFTSSVRSELCTAEKKLNLKWSQEMCRPLEAGRNTRLTPQTLYLSANRKARIRAIDFNLFLSGGYIWLTAIMTNHCTEIRNNTNPLASLFFLLFFFFIFFLCWKWFNILGKLFAFEVHVKLQTALTSNTWYKLYIFDFAQRNSCNNVNQG